MKKSLVIHPFLFAIFPVLFLFSHNICAWPVRDILVPIAGTICLASVSWSLLSVVLRDKAKAGFIISIFFVLFFSYGICYVGIKAFMEGVLGVSAIGTRGHVLLIWVLLFALGTYSFIKTRRRLHNLTNIANVVAGCLVMISLINIGTHQLKTASGRQGSESIRSIEPKLADVKDPSTLPDIYYIILDGYARADVLEEIYRYDNTDFLDHLANRGFYVAHESRSNYGQTFLSFASSLNMTYLDDLVDQIGIENRDQKPVLDMIRNSTVVDFLKHHGYEIVVFASGSSRTEIRNADIHMAARWSPDEFQAVLIGMTPIPFVTNQLGVYDEYGFHRERLLYTFDHLADVSELEGPIFVFAHIIAPHPPFVFGKHGQEIDPGYPFVFFDGGDLIRTGRLTREEYVDGYREQLIFVNGRIEEAVDGILSRSARPSIIILQADHGPASMLDVEDPDNTYFKERLAILNAYYLPDNGDTYLYDGITPVNTFRVILNHYFGTDYELLGDESYYSTWSHPYAFINVTDEMNAGIRTEDLE